MALSCIRRRRGWHCGVSGTTFEIAAAEVTFSFEVADHGLDGRTSSQLAFDDAEDAALLSRDEDAAWIWRIVPAIPLST